MHTAQYVTLSVLRCSPNGRVIFAGAHQDILVLRAATKKVKRIPTQGAWIGVRQDILSISHDQMLTLQDGDVMVLFTDGIIETANEHDDMFDLHRLESAIEELPNGTPAAILDRIFERVRDSGGRQDDDRTVLVAKFSAV